jgi:hypothetical protein
VPFLFDSLDLTNNILTLKKQMPIYIDKYDVTLALWQQVYNWAITLKPGFPI